MSTSLISVNGESRDFPAEIVAAFAALRPPSIQRQQATLVALYDAAFAGESQASVWKKQVSGELSIFPRSTHYKRMQERSYQEAYKLLTQGVARHSAPSRASREVAAALAIEAAQHRLLLAAPDFVDTLVEAATDPSVPVRWRLAAANSGLTHVNHLQKLKSGEDGWEQQLVKELFAGNTSLSQLRIEIGIEALCHALTTCSVAYTMDVVRGLPILAAASHDSAVIVDG